jgi:lipoprotein LpqH
VTHRWFVAAAAMLAAAGCSSQPPEYQPPPGALVAGTAQVTVNGQDTGTTDAVQCSSTGSLTTIETGDPASGVTAMYDITGTADGFDTAKPSFRTSGTFAIKVSC